ncbi:MAG: 23S rRNA (uracil(1939)-C(5))-methyltransferase RlmD [Acidobacteria bacterium]|nr:23S rRNA (uracil(1939)-C(5))-methyltransferase RlmD [Acidobacteriota bacterium]
MTCRHLGTCGGCSLAAPYTAQVDTKLAQLRRWFPHVPVSLAPSPIDEHFRHKVAFTFDPASRGGRIVMGHYRAGSQSVIAVEECPAHSERGNQLAFALRDRLAASHVPAGILRHVLVRTTDDEREAVMMLVVTANHKALRAPIRALLDSHEGPDGFFLNIHDRPGPYMVGDFTQRIAGRSHVREDVLGHSFLISPTAFFQTNVRAARELLRIVLAEVGPARRVLDLYSGSGLFAIPLARQGAVVTAVESNRQAVEDAEANARLNRLPRGSIRLIAARTEDAIRRAAPFDYAQGKTDPYDVVILDPPRQGTPDVVIDHVCGIGAPRIVYVSCNPERLAEELPRLARGGYALRRIAGVDMFPHTEHLEAVAVFDRAADDRARHVRAPRRTRETSPPARRSPRPARKPPARSR